MLHDSMNSFQLLDHDLDDRVEDEMKWAKWLKWALKRQRQRKRNKKQNSQKQKKKKIFYFKFKNVCNKNQNEKENNNNNKTKEKKNKKKICLHSNCMQQTSPQNSYFYLLSLFLFPYLFRNGFNRL